MKPKDIIIGKHYAHSDWPGAKWLGVGKRKMWTGAGKKNSEASFTNKCLVLVENDDPDYLGQVVQKPSDCFDSFWDDFRVLG